MTPSQTSLPRSIAQTEALLCLLRGRRRLLVLTHNNPDPDSLGAAIGLRHFASLAGLVDSRFALSGRILRAENQEMVRQLFIDMTPIAEIDAASFDCAALVDTQPGFGHDRSGRCQGRHRHRSSRAGKPACRHQSGVSRCSLRSRRHQFAGHDLLSRSWFYSSCEVATALIYGIKTDTADLSRNVSDLDMRAYDFLFPLVDREKLVTITRPRLPTAYFITLKEALRKVRLYGSVAMCSLGVIASVEMVAEFADLLLRMQGVSAVFCGGLVDNTYFVSVRTDAGGDAWRMIGAAMVGEQGTFGGHGTVAGGSIQLASSDTRGLRRLERRLERNILRSVGLEGANATLLADRGD